MNNAALYNAVLNGVSGSTQNLLVGQSSNADYAAFSAQAANLAAVVDSLIPAIVGGPTDSQIDCLTQVVAGLEFNRALNNPNANLNVIAANIVALYTEMISKLQPSSGGASAQIAANFAYLRAHAELVTEGECYVLSHTTLGDGGFGSFYWDATDTTADNNGTTIKVTTIAVGRWKRQYTGKVNVQWFGAIGNADTDALEDDTVAIQSAINYTRNSHEIVYLPAGSYRVIGTLVGYDGTQISGDTNFAITAAFAKPAYATTILHDPLVAAPLLTFTSNPDTPPPPPFLFHISVGNLNIQGSAISTYAIVIDTIIYGAFQFLSILGFDTAIYCRDTINNTFDSLYLIGRNSCVEYGYVGGQCTTDVWTNCTFTGLPPVGIETKGITTSIRFVTCLFEGLANTGVLLVRETDSMQFIGCYSEGGRITPAQATACSESVRPALLVSA